jgi:uncharacterized protein (TIGR01741 family)
METKKMETLYQQIANTLNNMIPEEWEKLFLYSEIREGFSQVYFYYYPENSEKPIYSLDIVDLFEIDSKRFKKLKQDLYEGLEELWLEFKEQDQEQWTNMTFTLDNTGEMNLEYGYEDISQLDPVEKQEKWEAKYLKG